MRGVIRRIARDRLALLSFGIISTYGAVAALASFGLVAGSWAAEAGPSYMPPSMTSLEGLFGTDIFGRSVLFKTIHGARVAISVGLVSTLISIPIGVFLGALGGYFGGRIDDGVTWLYTTVSSVPYVLLLLAITFVLGRGISAVYVALAAVSWVGLARVIRAEFLRHKNREYVVAAASVGVGHGARIFRHILPNVSHQIVVGFSLIFQNAIKSEVFLSFLGLGVQDQPSWGLMIDDAKLELARGVWWQLAAATGAMFFLVLAFNLFGDALRDALDPKLK